MPILEKISGLEYNNDFYCGYSPERINPGDKINKIENIVKVTSGSTPLIAEKVNNLYLSIIKKGTTWLLLLRLLRLVKQLKMHKRFKYFICK